MGILGLGPCLIGLVLVAILCLWTTDDSVPPAESPGPIGLWKVIAPEEGRGNRQRQAPPQPFRYDGRYVIVHLMSRWVWEWHPADDYWRLESAWDGNDLYFRGPYGNWNLLATFADSCFHDPHGWSFCKVGREALEGNERALVRRRAPYDHATNPSARGQRSILRNLRLPFRSSDAPKSAQPVRF
jgi:hypothetical protein